MGDVRRTAGPSAGSAGIEVVRRGALGRLARLPLACRLVVLEAPAGYGKSTLVAQWGRSRDVRWVRMRDVAGSAERLRESLAQAARRPDDEAGAPSVLAVDGVSRALATAEPAFLDGLAAGLPPGRRLVVCSRDRVSDTVGGDDSGPRPAVLRPEDLAFSPAEVHAVLAAAGVTDPWPTARVVVRATGGWPACVARAAALLAGSAEPAAAAREFDGAELGIAEYLRSEVLEHLPPASAELLLRASVLVRLSGPVCDAVLGTGSAELLRRVADETLLLLPDPDEDGTYRVRPLLAAMLATELRRRRPAEERELHRRAVAWFVGRRAPGAAIRHAVASGDVLAAARLVVRFGQPLADRGRTDLVLPWVSAVGEDAARDYPPYGVLAAWVWGNAGDLSRAMRALVAAERQGYAGPLPDGTASLDAAVALVRAATAPLGVERMLEDARLAVRLEPPGRPRRRLALMTLGNAKQLTGDPDAAALVYQEVVDDATADQSGLVQTALAQLALLAAGRGDWTAARDLTRRSAEATGGGRPNDLAVIVTHLAGATLAVHEGRWSDAAGEVDAAVAAFGRRSPLGYPWFAVYASLALGELMLDLGDADRARGMAEIARRHGSYLSTLGVLAERTSALEARLEDTRAEGSAPAPAGASLSAAELRVLRLLPTHLSLEDIGTSLSLSRNTVKSHVAAIHRKLGAANRAEAVRRAHERGLLHPAPRAGAPPVNPGADASPRR